MKLLALALFALVQDGVRWEAQKNLPKADWYDIDWVDANLGFVVGTQGRMIRTADGGKTWAKVDTGTDEDLRTVDFADADHGWIVGGKGVEEYISAPTLILRTQDSGKSWDTQSTGISFPPTRVWAFDAKRAWIVWGLGKMHPDGHWQLTANGGRSWTMPGHQDFFRPGRALFDVFFADEKNGWIVGSNTQVQVTIDGKNMETPIAGKKNRGGILRTSDGGETWVVQKAESPVGSFFTGVYFVDSKRGWVVDDAGNIFSTEDSGAAWVKQQSGIDTPLRGIFFQNETTGWTVGDKGVILQTTDAGKKWVRQQSGTDQDLLRVRGLKGGAPWAAGKGGVLLKLAGAAKSEAPHQPTPKD